MNTQKRYWLRGGIIGGILMFIGFWIYLIFDPTLLGILSCGYNLKNPSSTHCNIVEQLTWSENWTFILVYTFIGLILGTVIGFIIGKIKSKNKL